MCSISQSRETTPITQNTILHHHTKNSGVTSTLIEAILQYQSMVVRGLDVVGANIQDYLTQPKINQQINPCPQIYAIAELEGLDVNDIMYLGQYTQNIWIGVILDKGEIERYFF